MNKQEVLEMLDKSGIKYEKSEHIAVFTIDEMLAANLPYPETIAKNLFVRDDKKRNYYLITVLENKRVDLKEFQLKHNTRKLSFASENDLMDKLALTKGSVTPFGLLNNSDLSVKFFLDSDFMGKKIGIHPNDNTATVWLNTDDLLYIISKHGNEFEVIDL